MTRPSRLPSLPAEFDLDRIVATLAYLGVGYLYVQEGAEPYVALPTTWFINALVESKTARVEYSLVALLLRHPEYAEDVLHLAGSLPAEPGGILKRHYTAAVYLQRMYWPALAIYLKPMMALPDYFSAQLELPAPGEYYGEIGLRALVDRLPPPINWWLTYLDPLQMLIRLLSLQKTYAGLTD